MIAKVFPVRRMPASTGAFDYIAPSHASVGDLVEITFKGRAMPGIIWRLEEKSEIASERLTPIMHVVKKGFLSVKDIERIDALSLVTAQSQSTYISLLPIVYEKRVAKRPAAVARNSFSYTKEEVESARASAEKEYVSDSARLWPLHALFRIQKPGQHILICPNEEVARFMHGQLANKEEVGCVAGVISFDTEKATFEQWITGKLRVLITTRHAALWPAHKLAGVIVIDPGHIDYSFLPRNPRFDARFAGHLLAKQHGARISFLGHTQELQASKNTRATISFTLIDASKHPSEAPMLTLPIINATREALEDKKSVIFFLNKTGVATHYQCRNCGHLPTCGNCGAIPIIRENDLVCPSCHTEMWQPTHCPSCSKKTLSKKGIGVEHIKHSLEQLLPDYAHCIATEKQPLPKTFDTLIVSESGMRRLDLQPNAHISQVIDLAADYHFLDESYACEERAKYKLTRLLDIAKDCGAQCIIQTFQPGRITQLFAPNWAENELKLRKKHDLPPYGIELNVRRKEGISEIHRIIDKNALIGYLKDFQNLGKKDTIEVTPQTICYERIASPE